MQERKWITVLIPAVLLFGITSFASPAAAGSAKVEVCHFPPGNPDNFHTITISEKAFSAHLAHGDLGGACNALCATICDDENACTIDDTADCEEVGCPVSSTPVDCNDQNECTADSCDPVEGCVNAASVGDECDDDQVCSGPDTCDAAGDCQGAAIDNCCLGDEDCSQDLCDQASCNLDTNLCGEDPVVCVPPDPCTVSDCASDTGSCVDSAIVCPEEGQTCNPGTGNCEATDDPCNCVSIVCTGGQTCNPGTGNCEADPCLFEDTSGLCSISGCPYFPIVCPEAGQTCNPRTGNCEAYPCDDLVFCPTRGQVCNPVTGSCEAPDGQGKCVVACTQDSDCNDQNECTADLCDPVEGCVNTASVGAACDDHQFCSGPDTCDALGECQGEAIDNCCRRARDCSRDLCDQASCDLDTNRCVENPVVRGVITRPLSSGPAV
jgi:hypothetical protein